MRTSQRNHPQLYGPASEGESDRSSRLQAEVQRQMEEYMQRHQNEVATLQREVMELKRERERLIQAGGQPGTQASSDPQGNVQALPQSGPLNVPQASNEPQGNVQALPQSGPLNVPQAPIDPQGNVQGLPRNDLQRVDCGRHEHEETSSKCPTGF